LFLFSEQTVEIVSNKRSMNAGVVFPPCFSALLNLCSSVKVLIPKLIKSSYSTTNS